MRKRIHVRDFTIPPGHGETITSSDCSPPLDSTPALAYRLPVMLTPAKIYFLIFGVLTIAGGIIGYVKAGSTPSIIAGSITGIL
ncbi:MAG: TMEM14 family protein, partial [Chthoniobacterales bacterium]